MNRSGHLKKELVVALRKHLGIISSACEVLGVSRTTYYKYYNEDEAFRNEVDTIGEHTLDFVESKLFDLINNGNVAATIFYMKTKGKRRGYIERQEVEHNTNNITGIRLISE
jgi:predicted DNA-binding transcriptional regulator AlpA